MQINKDQIFQIKNKARKTGFIYGFIAKRLSALYYFYLHLYTAFIGTRYYAALAFLFSLVKFCTIQQSPYVRIGIMP